MSLVTGDDVIMSGGLTTAEGVVWAEERESETMFSPQSSSGTATARNK